MDQIVEGRSLPVFILMPATAAFAVMILLVLRQTSNRAAQFVVFAVWLRLILSAFHTITFKASPFGLSWNAVGSLVVCAIGVMVIKSRRVTDPALVPLYFLIAAILAAAGTNNAIAESLDPLVKYVYLAIIIMATADAIQAVGRETFCKMMLWPFAIPFGLQLISVLTHSAKATERDGSASYIGGFNHEAAFSLVLSTGLLVVALSRGLGAKLKPALIVACCVGIFLANYRTAILAMGPLLAVVMMSGVTRRFVPEQRALVAGAMAIVVAAGVAGFVATSGDRFADLAVVAEQRTALIKPVREFNAEERHILSARPVIWSRYILGYADSSPMQHVFGMGANSWTKVFDLYAHNTLVSTIYELGAFGVAAVIFLWGWMLWLACQVRDGTRAVLVAGHLSFLILNQATMPMWMIEGVIFYGLLCGATIASYNETRRQMAAASQRSGLAPPAPHDFGDGAAVAASARPG